MAEDQRKRALADQVAAAGDSEKAAPSAPGLEPIDRRGSIRLPFTASADVTELQSKAKVSGRCSDLGSGGCYVDTISSFPVGTAVKLRLAKSNRTFEGQATVVYAQAGMGMGLAFTDIQADQFNTIQQWIRELSGEPRPDLDRAEMPLAEQPPQRTERFVLNQLISLLVRKRLLTEAEGETLLRELFG